MLMLPSGHGTRRAGALRVPGLSSVLTLLVLLAAAGALVVFVFFPPNLLDWHEVQNTAVQFLRRDEMMFLVTDRIVTRVDVTSKSGSTLLGWHEAILVGTAECLYGIDLEKLEPEAVQREGELLVVHMPEPEILNVSIDLDSLQLYSKRSGLIAIKEYMQKRDVRDEMQSQLERRAREFVVEHDLLPDRAALVGRLNEWAAPLLGERCGVAVEFR
jgi:hypothetical protein